MCRAKIAKEAKNDAFLFGTFADFARHLKLSPGSRRVSGEVQTGSSYVSQNDPRLHFGLADDARYDRIEVAWPGGGREVFPAGAANRIVVLEQGTGAPAPSPGRPASPRP